MRYLTPDEAAEIIGLNPRMVHKRMSQGRLKFVQFGAQRHQRESSEAVIAFTDMTGDMVATSTEIDTALKESREQLEAVMAWISQLEFLQKEAKENDGKVILDMSRMKQSIVA